MLELTVDAFHRNAYYKHLPLTFIDITGKDYDVLEVDKFGVNYYVTLSDRELADLGKFSTVVKILGGHELFFCDFEMLETVE